MITYQKIKQILDTALKTVSDLPPLQLENKKYDPNVDKYWCRCKVLAVEPEHETLFSHGNELLQGLYQIDLFVPLDKGTTKVNSIAENIITTFPAGGSVQSNGDVVFFDKSFIETAQIYDNFYQLPVVVKWWSIQQRQI